MPGQARSVVVAAAAAVTTTERERDRLPQAYSFYLVITSNQTSVYLSLVAYRLYPLLPSDQTTDEPQAHRSRPRRRLRRWSPGPGISAVACRVNVYISSSAPRVMWLRHWDVTSIIIKIIVYNNNAHYGHVARMSVCQSVSGCCGAEDGAKEKVCLVGVVH